jgi:CDP-glucose 4,6-dehydratase
LHALGAKVTGYALPPPTTPSLHDAANLPELIDARTGDIRDLKHLLQTMRECQPEVVLHLAAQSLVRASYDQPVETYGTNVMGTVHVLEAVRQVPGVRAVVVVTSDKCYENREWLWGYRETEAMGGHDPYSSSKGCAELVTAAYRRSYFGTQGPAIATARAGNVIGGGDWALDRLVPDILKAFAEKRTVTLRNPGAIRPWQHVLEPLAGYLLLAQRLTEEGVAFADAWNFGPPRASEVPVVQVAETLRNLWGAGVVQHAGEPAGPHEAGLLRLDSSKAAAHLGWQPRLGLQEALALTVEWQRAFVQNPLAARDVTLAQIQRYETLPGVHA